MSAVEQLMFLLDQAPMLDAPENLERAAHAFTKFAYVHPRTWEQFTCTKIPPAQPGQKNVPGWIHPSPTKWIFTTLMPQGRVIYSQNLMPRLEQ